MCTASRIITHLFKLLLLYISLFIQPILGAMMKVFISQEDMPLMSQILPSHYLSLSQCSPVNVAMVTLLKKTQWYVFEYAMWLNSP